MAVVRMKRLSAVIPAERKEVLLHRLQDLGVLQPVPLGGTGELDGELVSRLTVLKRHRSLFVSISAADASVKVGKSGSEKAAGSGADLGPELEDVVVGRVSLPGIAQLDSMRLFDRRVLDAIDGVSTTKSGLDARHSALVKEEGNALSWGQLCQQDIQELRAASAFIRVYRVRAKQVGKVEDYLVARGFSVGLAGAVGVRVGKVAAHSVEAGNDGHPVVVKILPHMVGADSAGSASRSDGRNYATVALISLVKDPVLTDLEEMVAPVRRLDEIRRELAQVQAELAKVDARLAILARHVDVLDREEGRILDEMQLSGARAGALNRGDDEHLFAITGWCPAPSEEAVRELVLSAGGGVLVADPAPGDEPPILLKNGPLTRAFEPLVKMFQLPNYNEADPTFLVAPFMGIFFGFCFGDSGYGIALILLAFFLQKKFFRNASGDTLKVMNLLKVLGSCSVVVGLLMGSFFGLTLYKIPELQKLGLNEDMLLFQFSANPEKFFYLSLGLGVVQLVLGLVIKLVRAIRYEEYQKAIGVVGWITLFPGVAVWVLKGTPILFLAGMALILLFENPSRKIGARIGSGAWALYNITGLFGDVMSYARIFGLGLSSGIIATVINYMAVTVRDSVPVAGWIGALLILVFGHSFNFLMGVLGSLVHPARLQFLEFFGKFFEGGGSQYRPLQRHSKGG